MISARLLAYQILLHMDQKVSHPDRLIRAMLQRHSRMDDRDRALTTELVYGVLRWQGRLDWHIDQLSKTKPKKIDSAIRIALRLALYQIFFLDRIPPHAAVNETVKLVKSTQPAHLAGFANALLREAIRRDGRWNWPQREKNPEEYLSVTTSHPTWFVSAFLKDKGFEETRSICDANNTIAPMVLRINTLKTAPSLIHEWLRENEIDAVPSPYLPNTFRVSGLRKDVSHLSVFADGMVQVQDEASQLIAHLLAPKPEQRVLDLCSGFGGKSTHLGIMMENRGEILAVDKLAWKIEELKENADRQGVRIIKARSCDLLEFPPREVGSFDRVLLDAPCTGFGSLRRNPDIKWRRHLKDPVRFARLQKELLKHAALFVKSGGVLVYATCTVFKEENDEVAEDFSASHPDFTIESAADFLPENCQSMADGNYFRSWPHRHGVDGFFGTRWRRG